MMVHPFLFLFPIVLFPIKHLAVDVPLVVFGEIITFPSLLAGPLLGWVCPERIRLRQAKRKECKACHVERTVVGVPVSHIRMRTHKANGEETAFVVVLAECLGAFERILHLSVEHAVGHSCDG